MNPGIAYAFAAYVLWGLFPLYFKAVQQVSALEILAHRMLWSLIFVFAVLAVLRRWDWLRQLIAQPRLALWFVASSAVISVNWGLYIWSVNAGHVVDASLGYFINPLVNVLIGSVFLHERLRPVQWLAVALAACGVAWLTWQAGHPPWIGLALAATFATYGLLRKTAALGAIDGLAVETALLLPVALGYLLWLASRGQNAFLQADLSTQALLAAAGPITAIPLMLFAAGARRVQFATLGLLQYIGPTLQFLLGVWLYNEAFDQGKALGYGLIWLALIVFSLEGLWSFRRSSASAAAVAREAASDS